MNSPTPSPTSRRGRVADGGALAVMALGLAVMAGWLLGIEPLKRMLPQLATMKFNTALGFLLAGGALFFRGKPAVRLGLAGAVGLLGALTLGQDLAGSDFGIDQIFVRADAVAGLAPGRMSLATAACFLLSGAALGLLGRRAMERWAEALAISVGTVGFIALLGSAFGAQNLYRLPGFASVALHTAVGFAVLAAGLLGALPEGIVVLRLRSRGTGRSLWLGFGALTALLIVLGLVTASRLHSIGADVDAMSDVARPRAVAARELEVNVLQYGLEVRSFLAGDAAARERRLQHADEVAQHLATYQRLAETPQQRELAARFAAQWQSLHTLGEAFMAAGTASPEELARTTSLRLALVAFLDDEMQPESVAFYNARRAATHATIQTTEAVTLLLLIAGVVLALVTSGVVARTVLGAEETLRAGERRFRSVTETLPQLVWTCLPDGRCDYLGPQWVAYTGIPEAEQLGYGWAQQLHPDDREPSTAEWQKASASGGDFDVEFRIRRRDGVYRWFKTRAVPLRDPAGVILKWFGTNTDIEDRLRAEEKLRLLNAGLEQRVAERTSELSRTVDALQQEVAERKQAEEAMRVSESRFRMLFENSPYCIHEMDREGRLISMNRAGLNMMGVQEERAICGLPYLSAVADEDRERIGRLLQLAFQGQASAFEFKASNGLVFQSSFVPITDAEGAVVRLMGLTQDITARQQAEDQIKASLRDKEVLLAEVHHRVKNNLQIVSSLLSLQGRRLTDPAALEAFASTRDRVRAMGSVHELLYRRGDFSEIDFAGQLGHLARTLMHAHAPAGAAVRPALQLDPVKVDLNTAVPLSLIASELITNALKYAFAGRREGTLTIRLRTSGQQHELRIADDGPGFPAALDPAATPTLGLRLVRDLARQIRAELEIDRAASGASVLIRWPAQPEADEAPSTFTPPPTETSRTWANYAS